MAWKRPFALTVVLCVLAVPAVAGPVVVHLGSAGAVTKLAGQDGDLVSFVLRDLLPNQQYDVTVEFRPIPVPALDWTPPAGLFAGGADPCELLLASVKALAAAKDEAGVAAAVSGIEGAMGACPEQASLAAQAVQSTTRIVPGAVTLRAGTEVVLTVRRGGKTWAVTVSGGDRGAWVTTYGAMITRRNDDRFYANPNADGTFTVTPEQKVDALVAAPAVMFTWLPRHAMLSNLWLGPSAGVGAAQGSFSLFAGLSLAYNTNLMLNAGVAVVQQTRLNGRYTSGQSLKATVPDDQLNEKTLQSTWFVGLTFRFGKNPFEAGGGKSAGAAAGSDAGAAKPPSGDKDKAGAQKHDAPGV